MTRVGAQYLGGDFSPKEFAVGAEAAGFDSVWAGDHVSHYVDGIATLGCFAGATETIEIGTDVLVAPFRPAVVTAKGIATVASIAGADRVIVGIGIGGDFPRELQAVGADPRHRGAFTDEALEAMALLWSGEKVSFSGRWTKFERIRIEPAPAVAPRIWIGGRADAALRRAVTRGTGYLGYLLTPNGVAKRAARLAEIAAEEQRAHDGFDFACNLFFMPADSVDGAVDAAVANGMGLPQLTPDQARSFLVLGDDDASLARLAEYVSAGVTHVILGCAPGARQDLERFLEASARLLPEVRKMTKAMEVS